MQIIDFFEVMGNTYNVSKINEFCLYIFPLLLPWITTETGTF